MTKETWKESWSHWSWSGGYFNKGSKNPSTGTWIREQSSKSQLCHRLTLVSSRTRRRPDLLLSPRKWSLWVPLELRSWWFTALWSPRSNGLSKAFRRSRSYRRKSVILSRDHWVRKKMGKDTCSVFCASTPSLFWTVPWWLHDLLSNFGLCDGKEIHVGLGKLRTRGPKGSPAEEREEGIALEHSKLLKGANNWKLTEQTMLLPPALRTLQPLPLLPSLVRQHVVMSSGIINWR